MNSKKINNNQSGRSILEMLGVLAVMGVLTVGTLYGYRYAMEKYRTNALINDIQLRLTDLNTQIERGIPPTLTEWQQSTSGFIFSDIETSNDQPYFSVQTLPQTICQSVADIFKESYEISINDKFVSESASCEKNNILKFYLYLTPCVPACPTDEYCENGICMGGNNAPLIYGGSPCFSNSDCPNICWYCNTEKNQCASFPNNTPCFIGKEEGFCYYRGCVPQTETCKTHDDCAIDEYCGDKNDNCSKTTPYKCKKLNATKKTIILDNGQKETWYFSKTTLMYWDALRFCERLGKKMIQKEEILSRLKIFQDQLSISSDMGGMWCYDTANGCYAPVVYTNGTIYNKLKKNRPDWGNYAVCR